MNTPYGLTCGSLPPDAPVDTADAETRKFKTAMRVNLTLPHFQRSSGRPTEKRDDVTLAQHHTPKVACKGCVRRGVSDQEANGHDGREELSFCRRSTYQLFHPRISPEALPDQSGHEGVGARPSSLGLAQTYEHENSQGNVGRDRGDILTHVSLDHPN